MQSKTPQWQSACKKTLLDFSRNDSLRFWGWGHIIDGEKLPPFDYRYEHTLAVVKLGKWLAPLVNADKDILICSAWLHDCKKRLGTKGKDNHAKEAAESVEGILNGTDFPPEKIPAVQHAILHHVGLKLAETLNPIETACLWDIDKLSKLGTASLIHSICILPAFQPATTAEILSRGENWLEIAHSIVTSMNTAPAKSEATRRFELLQSFYKRFREELSSGC
ncbi:MAG: HD domain-containing protein [Holophagaceae bacterium]|nr:HD domain-containing protein [Holophagaceae bacterium]